MSLNFARTLRARQPVSISAAAPGIHLRPRVLAASLAAALSLGATAAVATEAGMLSRIDYKHAVKVLPERTGNGLTIRLQQDIFDPTLRAAALPPGLTISAARGEGDYYLVQFDGPIDIARRRSIERSGAKIVDYVPDFAFLVKSSPVQAQILAGTAGVRWSGLFQPAFRVSNDLLAALPHADSRRTIDLNVRLFAGEPTTALDAIQSKDLVTLGGVKDSGGGAIVSVRVPETMVSELAMIPQVAWIEPRRALDFFNGVSRGNTIMRKDFVETELGLYGENQVVAVGDTGFSTGNPATVHLDVRGRVLGGNTAAGSSCGGWADGHSHGTHVTGSVLGNGTLSGSNPATHSYSGSQAGLAPEANLYMWGFCNDFTGLPANMYTDYYGVIRAADPRARINTNSWGYTTGQGQYNAETRETDRFIRDNPDFTVLYAAGNEGDDGNNDGVIDPASTNMPSTAKNVITVGASENLRLTGGLNPGGPCSTWGDCFDPQYQTPPLFADRMSDNINGMVAFSSRGPVNDGRLKPDIVAPGSNILSTRYQGSATGWGVHDANYIYNGGTSMATPLVAGASAIVREFYQDVHAVAIPTAALIKATLINGAFDMSPGQYGIGATRDVQRRPDINQGWGRVDLGNSLVYDDGRELFFHEHPTGLATGNNYSTTITVADNAVPLRASLVWTDVAGTEASFGALVNDLDLTLTSPTNVVFRGNDRNGDGLLDGDFDRTNNVEGVDVPAPETGEWTVTVNGFNVPQGPQQFALVVTAGVPQAPFFLGADPSSVSACAGNPVNVDINVGQDVPTFVDPVALALTGNPAPTTGSFSLNNQPAPYTSVLTLGNTAGVASGDYVMTVTGTSGAEVDDANIALHIDAAAPADFDLLTPADGATDVALIPTLTWEASTEVASYLVEVATDAAFTNIVHSATVSGTSTTLPSALGSTTQYFWRVSTDNACGDTDSTVFDFTTREAPRILLVDDDNNLPDNLAKYQVALDAVTGAGPGSYDVLNTVTQGEPTAVMLSQYDQVVWFSGDVFGSGNATNPLAGPTAATEAVLAAWLAEASGNCLLLSSQDYFYDRDEVVSSFMSAQLGVNTITNDPSAANRYTSVTGENVYSGLSGALTYPADFANWLDHLTVRADPGVQRAYVGAAASGTGNGAGAAVSKLSGQSFTTFYAFPIENLPAAGTQATIQRFFDTCPVGSTPNTAPTFTGEPYSGSVAEEAVATTAVTTITATDPEVPTQTLAYSITGGNTGSAFAIDGATGAITVATPAAVQPGAFNLAVRVTDGVGGQDTSTVTVTVTEAVNDAPVFTSEPYAFTVSEESIAATAVGTVGSTDPDGGAPTYAITGGNTGSAFAIDAASGAITVATPAAVQPGTPFALALSVSDGNGGSDTGVATVTVTNVNDAPLADDDSFATNEDEALSVPAPGVLAGDTDVDNVALTATDLTQPANGTVVLSANGAFTYTPDENYCDSSTPDTFTYTAFDGTAASTPATVSVTVNCVNDGPTADTLDDVQATATFAFSLDVSDAFTEPKGETLTFSATGLPASLTISSAGVISGTLLADDIGSYNVMVTARDPADAPASSGFTLLVVPVNIMYSGFEGN